MRLERGAKRRQRRHRHSNRSHRGSNRNYRRGIQEHERPRHGERCELAYRCERCADGDRNRSHHDHSDDEDAVNDDDLIHAAQDDDHWDHQNSDGHRADTDGHCARDDDDGANGDRDHGHTSDYRDLHESCRRGRRRCRDRGAQLGIDRRRPARMGMGADRRRRGSAGGLGGERTAAQARLHARHTAV